MNEQTFMEWIMSLNPVAIDVDEEGNPVDETQVKELADRIKSEVEEIRNERDGE